MGPLETFYYKMALFWLLLCVNCEFYGHLILYLIRKGWYFVIFYDLVSISIILWLRGCQGNFIWKLVMHTLMFWWKPFLRTLIIGLCFQEHELYEEVRLKSSLVLGFLFWELFFSSKFVSSFYLWDNSPSHFYFLNFPGILLCFN